MKTVMLAWIAAGTLVVVAGGPVAAQTAAGGVTAKTVDPIHPFGSINVYNVGLEPAQVAAWAKTLDAGQKQDMVNRCAVIVQSQQSYFAETTNFCQTFAIAVAQDISGNGANGR